MIRADPRQFDLFAAPEPPVRNLAEEHQAAIEAFTPANMVGRDKWKRPQVQTRAASHGGIITMYNAYSPEPFELVVRGVPCVISFHGGYATHAIEPAGSGFWSETGYRSFGGMLTDPAEIAADIEAYIDAPAKGGKGCGGKLKPWWQLCVLNLQQRRAYMTEHDLARWDQPDVANNRRWHDEAVAQVIAAGLDPDVVAPWPKGKKPKLAVAG